MKKIRPSLIVMFLVFSFMRTEAQINCNSFCVTNIQMDTAAHFMDITIFMSGTSSDFINYPYVAMVTDTLGDTLATANMNFFGQFGNSSQVYTDSTILDSIPTNFHCIVYLHYDTITCALPYPCIPNGIAKYDNYNPISIYPNPTSGRFTLNNSILSNDKSKLIIYNIYGENVYSKNISTQITEREIDLSSFAKGIYLIEVRNSFSIYRQKIIVQ